MSDAVTRVMLNTRLDPGVQLNDTYEIDERIASGGMGEVYRGHNIQTGEPVAIKTILPELADQEAISALFKKEATVLGRLHHETIVRYYSFSRDPRLGRTYLAMEFVDGTSLADRIRTAPLTPDEVRKLFAKVADGLALAHSAGVIHRDLSPDNIILRGDRVDRPTIIDFGIARSANVGDGTLIGGGFAGKFNFVSPEQLGLHNREVEARSDIYSLGLVIAAALRGSPIDMGGSHVEVIEKRSRMPDLSDIDAGLRPLVEAMLQPNPDERPADAAAVSEWLRATATDGQRTAPSNGGPVSPTGAQGIAFGTQPGVQWTSPVGQTGTPFAGAQTSAPSDPTQFVPPTSPPFSTSRPPAGGESPFGPAVSPTTASSSLPGTALPGAPFAAEPVKQRSNTGRYALAGGALLLLLAAGGAYMGGLIDLGGDSQQSGNGSSSSGTGTSGTDTSGTGTSGTDTSGTSAETKTTGGQAKSPEHEAIADALEDIGKNDQTTGPTGDQTTGPTGGETGSTGSQTGTTGGQTTGPTGGQTDTATTSGGSDTGTQTTGTSGTSTGTGTTGSSGQSGTDGAVHGPDDGTQQTTDGLTKMVDVGVSWLRQYDGGRCFFVAVTSVTDKTINVKGFGLDAPVFEKLYNTFIQTNGFEPEVNGHTITDAQCAAVDFLKTIQPGTKSNPQVQLTSDMIKSGDTLEVNVANAADQALDLLLVDADGFVYNMKSFAKETVANGRNMFDIKMGAKTIAPNSPQMVIALTSPSGLAVPTGGDKARAADLFPRLAREIEVQKSNVGVDFAYFRLSP